MIPGVWSSYFIDLAPEAMVAQFAKKDWLHLELSDEHAAVLLERGDPVTEGQRFAAHVRNEGVSFPQGHLWLGCDITAGPPDATVDRLKRWLDLFMAVGVRAAVLHPGGAKLRENGVEDGVLLEARVRVLGPLTAYVADSGLTICLENTAAAPFAGELRAIVAAVDAPNLGICFDTGHLHMAKGDPREFVRIAGPHLKALHIADNDGSADQHLMPYGHGTVPWGVVVRAVKDAGYAGLFNLEIGGETRCPMPVRLAKLDFLKTVVSFMLAD